MKATLVIPQEELIHEVFPLDFREICPEAYYLESDFNTLSVAEDITKREFSVLFIYFKESLKQLASILIESISSKIPIVFISPNQQDAYWAIKMRAFDFLLSPISKIDFQGFIKNYHKSFAVRGNPLALDKFFRNTFLPQKMIGIPSMEGLEYVTLSKIVYCEGLQRCTKVVLTDKKNHISSYNIGQFRKILEPLGFYSPHRSFLINPNLMLAFRREGYILMQDKSTIPIARRKRQEFLELIDYIKP